MPCRATDIVVAAAATSSIDRSSSCEKNCDFARMSRITNRPSSHRAVRRPYPAVMIAFQTEITKPALSSSGAGASSAHRDVLVDNVHLDDILWIN